MLNKSELENFTKKVTPLPKIVIIYGPTASWKTSMSIDIAEYLNSEIISADSRQIYKNLDIWTWKIKEAEKRGVKHHMLDIIEIDKEYSVSEYKKEVTDIIGRLHSEWKIPVICWWTGLYLDAIAFNFDIPEIKADWQYRDELENIRLKKWNLYLWEMLEKVDKTYAQELEINNFRYVMRWLEVFKQTGKSKKELKKKLPPIYDILFITPYDWDRVKLYSRINERIGEMFEEWLIEETQNILNSGFKKTDFGLNTIWYKEVIRYIEQEYSLEECIDIVRQHNRNYAKRQLTWFRKYKN
ncbi:MAG: tRNA delta(2)-isopentenylpyrophosphate transferase [uncultured bacterium (gcode 4)]|uniref:tRNA dimethylallyltransferase n=1 Tax=uncultured bacterium (gcode 4) TaxID=1234023 RepID=K2G3C1_9BACT|nr:MAG: tRNA delta(2)-isopentenylpyrophosphate transferase [uncultured bacterium (gcode 4)]